MEHFYCVFKRQVLEFAFSYIKHNLLPFFLIGLTKYHKISSKTLLMTCWNFC